MKWIDEVLTLALSQKIKLITPIEEDSEKKKSDVSLIKKGENISNEKSH